MTKVAIIGAGSVVFAKRIITDLLSFPALQNSTISLMDIDPARLELATAWTKKAVASHKLPARVESSTNRLEAITDADYVVIMIQVGGLEAFEQDIKIPLKYGIKQCVGDTLGPGGVFRGLRTIPVLLDICDDMAAVCPNALLINYSNPMAINCWAMNAATDIQNVGLCHSVQGSAAHIARVIGADPSEMTYWCAGINHMAWYLDFQWKGRDVYPLLREKIEDPAVFALDKVRFEMFKHLDYYVTESSGHFSEYIPYFRKRDELIDEFCTAGFGGETGYYFRACSGRLDPHTDQIKIEINGESPITLDRSHEYGTYIINSIETNTPYRINGNVNNDGLITNLPKDCCVEVPCLVDGAGLHPCIIGDLPPQLAALNRSNISVQEMAVYAGIWGDRRLAFQAVMADPLTAAILSPGEIQKMVDEMFEAESTWLPQFQEVH